MKEKAWKDITLVLWGATVKLVTENEMMMEKVKEMIEMGVNVSACKSCVQKVGVEQVFKEIGIKAEAWGHLLTDVLMFDQKLLTI